MASRYQARVRSRDRGERHPSDYSTHSQPQSQSNSGNSTPVPGTKRLFSNRDSRQPNDQQQRETTAQDGAEGEGEYPSEKRHRSADWPLVSASPNGGLTPRPARQHRKKSPPSGRRARAPIPPSKFVEGSMNDRVSQVPPVPYLGPAEEELLSQHSDAGCGEGIRGRNTARGRFMHHTHSSISASSNVSDASRSSSLFRFGKTIAASFNPTNWKFWTKEEQAADDEEAAQRRVLQERQMKAEKIYQQLKESGHFRDSAYGPRAFPPPSAEKRGSAAKHDSGIEFGDVDYSSARSSTSIDEKRKEGVCVQPPRVDLPPKEFTPMPNYTASLATPNTSTPGGKSMFNFKKPSLSNLKKASLTNIKSAFTGESTSTANVGLGIGEQHQARRIASRKDLQKQQKLVKRVSNLEERLKQARQQLAEALQDPVPDDTNVAHVSLAKRSSQGSFDSQTTSRLSRAIFVPGAMPSLPSERLLAGFVSSEVEDDEDDEHEETGNGIGQAVTTDYEMGDTRQVFSSAINEKVEAGQYTSHVGDNRETRAIHGTEDLGTAQENPSVTGYCDTLQSADGTTATKPASSTMEVEDTTPKPVQPAGGRSNKRKSKSEDDDFIPLEPSDSEDIDDVESDIISEVSSISRPAQKPTSSTTNPRGTGPTITLTYPKKIQKTVPGSKTSSVSVPTKKAPHDAVHPGPESSLKSKPRGSEDIPPPTRTAPAPPTRTAPAPPDKQALGRSPSKKPVYSPHPSSRVYQSTKPVAVPSTGRQQSASPPPSSASFTGPGLFYTKPSQNVPGHPRTLNAPNLPKATAPKVSRQQGPEVQEKTINGIPPLPPMPKSVRLASGEIINTAEHIAPRKPQKNRSKPPSAHMKYSADGPAEIKSEEREAHKGMSNSSSKRSFDWPDDCF
ncbi:uncharacterized protein L3040_009512 [Drepanopeziza brunnea f. sp. 'multigermtubi']|uniref:uncharacterized protein n=1 Tax=Drepanopeziza brunnea f. sp. 'multigermtubi' TaxID=698441 RepID=UPI0023A4B211|nr:hypothetical protein L3040_009512 [Drepanopeziza brunnea f. sp. 'multigermtubi']